MKLLFKNAIENFNTNKKDKRKIFKIHFRRTKKSETTNSSFQDEIT